MKNQTIKDRVNAAFQGVVGDPVSMSIYKATTEEEIPPKEKHLAALCKFTRERTVSLSQMTCVFSERLLNSNHYVIVKALSVIHYLILNGEENFFTYLSSDPRILKIKLRVDTKRSDSRGAKIFIDKYINYLKVKAENYYSLGFDPYRIPKGSKNGSLQFKDIKALIPICEAFHTISQTLFELNNDAFPKYNNVAKFSNVLINKDAITLYLCYNDAAIALIEKFFDLDKKCARHTYNEYVKFQNNCENFNQIFSNSKECGISGIPSITKVAPSLIDSMLSHLLSIESTTGNLTTAGTSKEFKNPETNSNIDQIDIVTNKPNSQIDDLFDLNDTYNQPQKTQTNSMQAFSERRDTLSDLFQTQYTTEHDPFCFQQQTSSFNDNKDPFSSFQVNPQSEINSQKVNDPFDFSHCNVSDFTSQPQAHNIPPFGDPFIDQNNNASMFISQPNSNIGPVFDDPFSDNYGIPSIDKSNKNDFLGSKFTNDVNNNFPVKWDNDPFAQNFDFNNFNSQPVVNSPFNDVKQYKLQPSNQFYQDSAVSQNVPAFYTTPMSQGQSLFVKSSIPQQNTTSTNPFQSKSELQQQSFNMNYSQQMQNKSETKSSNLNDLFNL